MNIRVPQLGRLVITPVSHFFKSVLSFYISFEIKVLYSLLQVILWRRNVFPVPQNVYKIFLISLRAIFLKKVGLPVLYYIFFIFLYLISLWFSFSGCISCCILRRIKSSN